ncbi:cilia- and flagella-associated protein 45 isoform X2 [Sorex araneus]|uniref:cilia- and flagella-associated protein 45 isoform X2 n=2 Tax=Sorex araneus TaxID=42254 RepID=UPI0024335EA7|nr:cilia- and flagella-associated protein 45 isoform X2 [Sorex araneus]
MPLSPPGILSSASTVSGRAKARTRYRTKAQSSEVDECLFGGVKPVAQSDSPMVLLRDRRTVRNPLATLGHKPETIRLITRDLVRELIVPTKDPSGKSLIISPEEFERIKGASTVQTREEREAQELALQKEKDRMLVATGHRGSPAWPTEGLLPGPQRVSCPAHRGSPARPREGSPARPTGGHLPGPERVTCPAHRGSPARPREGSPARPTGGHLPGPERGHLPGPRGAGWVWLALWEGGRRGLSSPARPQDAATTRKKVMQQREMVWRGSQARSALEEEAQERARGLLQRAGQQRMEQEEELREMNQIILNAKCHAIRDAQILEKQQIRRELEAEEKRLDQMMEAERQKSLQREEQLQQRRREERLRSQRHILEQIEQRQEERSLLGERQEQEKEQLLAHMDRLLAEDLKDLELRRQHKLQLQAEIRRVNEETQRQKALLQEQEKLADEMVMEFTQKKLAREAELEKEQQHVRREKEKEIARLRALQEKAQDYRAEQDALRAKRNQEVADREWRRREKEKAQRKLETEEQLRQTRLDQMASKEHARAVQVHQDRAEFQSILRMQREQVEQERQEEARRAETRRRHADEVRSQVREQQQRQVQARVDAFEEGRRLQEEAQRRSQHIAELRRQKLQELRATGLPEKYCVEAERKAKILAAPS